MQLESKRPATIAQQMRQAAEDFEKEERRKRKRKDQGKNTPVFECLREVSATRTISLLLPDPPHLHSNSDTQLAEKEEKKSRGEIEKCSAKFLAQRSTKEVRPTPNGANPPRATPTTGPTCA